MNNYYAIIFIIIVAVTLMSILYSDDGIKEPYNIGTYENSQNFLDGSFRYSQNRGTLIQLTAKDPAKFKNKYLTANTYKYIPPWWNQFGYYYPWYYPTRHLTRFYKYFPHTYMVPY